MVGEKRSRRSKSEKRNERAHLRLSFSLLVLDQLLPMHPTQPRHHRPNSSSIIKRDVGTLSDGSIFSREKRGSRGGGSEGEGGGELMLDGIGARDGRSSLWDGVDCLGLSDR